MLQTQQLKTKKTILLVALCAALSGAAHAQPVAHTATLQDSRTTLAFDRFAKTLAENLVQSSDYISVQYALIDLDTIVVSGQVGENVKPLNHETVYGIGSVSKMFAAASVMKLAETNALNLDTPIYRYLPDFTMADPRYKRITARMLLNHSAGLRGDDYVNDALISGDNSTDGYDNFLAILSTQELNADPGAYSVYCNSCFTLSEKLVERVSGKSFTQYITDTFLRPLGMTHSSTPENASATADYAYFKPEDQSTYWPWIHYNVIASGGINSTAEDMASFARVFMQNGAGILSENSLAQMQAAEYRRGLWPAEADDSGNYGLGWDSVKLYPFNDLRMQALAKGGDITSHHASLVVLPQHNMAAVVLSTGGSSSLNQQLATKLLLQALATKGIATTTLVEKNFPVLAGVIMPQQLASYAGEYAHSDGRLTITISQSGELNVYVPDTDVQSFQYAGNQGFVSPDRRTRIEFVDVANGRTYLWVRRYSTHPFLGQTATSEFQAQKLQPSPLNATTKEAWAARNGVRYYPVKLVYNSERFLTGLPPEEVHVTKDFEGYWGAKRIRNANSAISEVQIPGQAGRETQLATFETRDSKEYLHLNDDVLISQQSITALTPDIQHVEIASDGLATWFGLTPATAGYALQITVPDKGAYAIYDGEANNLHYSVVDGSAPITLPAQGALVLAGLPGTTFQIRMVKN
ncbi:serine hydrolase domain-containing protein [Paenalcaligenes sp. Me131]|uniref:serine hydrolase domain-containing protein n=1 Tax=Paenalcaligenes sp. Me131 TaxID=3392636 RepID=UPI003D27508E